MGRPIYALGRSQRHRRLNESLNRMRESRGSVTVSSGIAVRDLMRALRRRERVGILGDQSAGRDRGLLVRLFGRRTTLPTGGFELAAKTGAVLLPCFTVRVAPGRHEIHIDEPLAGPGIPVWSLEEQMKRYLRRLEELIAAHPEQWFWAKKRWKYSWTKRLVILSDGKPGHVKQSKAVAEAFRSITDQYGREGMEYPTSIVDVRFRSGWRKRLFYVFAWLFHPWAQGRLEWLKFFFTPETHRALLSAGADFVISAGTALIGLNRCLARECAAKSVVLMKPPFPYNLFRYDLALVPAHDEGPLPAGSLRTLLTPAQSDAGEEYEVFYEKMRAELRDPGRVRIGVFLGGPTRRFTFGLAEAKDLMESLEKIPDRHGDFLLTTSRRTPADVDRFLKKNRARFRRCQKMIIASEDPRPGVPEAVRRLCDILIVTQDSVSMISEAVSSGKPVIVLNLGRGRVPVKHRRFREILEREGAVVGSGLSELERALDEAGSGNAAALAAREKAELKKKLEEIL
jgi:mitochondrial fission protein ELM1